MPVILELLAAIFKIIGALISAAIDIASTAYYLGVLFLVVIFPALVCAAALGF